MRYIDKMKMRYKQFKNGLITEKDLTTEEKNYFKEYFGVNDGK